ncbi:MAG: hypothetical protein ACRC0W_03215 [Cetobacterium sp.]
MAKHKINFDDLEFYILKVLKKLKTDEEIYQYFITYSCGYFKKKNSDWMDSLIINKDEYIKNSLIIWDYLYCGLKEIPFEQDMVIEDSIIYNYLQEKLNSNIDK